MKAIRLPPLRADSWLVELPVEGFAPASVSVPLGAVEPAPVLIALHGMGDRPEWQCGSWRGISDARSFVVCPRGVHYSGSGSGERFTYESAQTTSRELRAALKALKARFGAHVASGAVVLAGFSLGASHAVRIALEEPSFFSRLALVEGGADAWSATVAAAYAQRGGERVLFACGQARCKRRSDDVAFITQRANARAKVVYPGPIGHVLDGRMSQAIRSEFSWLVEGDARWRAK